MDANEFAALAALCMLTFVVLLVVFFSFAWGYRMAWRRAAEHQSAHEKVQQFLPCGHHASMAHHSAESGELLYCEACDDKSARADAEQMERENLQRARVAEAMTAEACRALRCYDDILAVAPPTHELDDAALGTAYRQWQTVVVGMQRPTDWPNRVKAAGAAVKPLIDEP